ncbi:hypothetical protein RZ71_09160 [Apilactobacillus kunkeei]|uniref:GmrSD restriction endonucleases N-terminal domain-containing protein n=1 Tax=Apilactobacillus kunkeei TaxID=148814 RepID=A0A0M9DDF9_9LACO|nr:DUF262 domain-containing protein [Apilactobacillus kunkeei]KOY77017.1 hypothetical protein RZ71_09160 [Apilactobacillus kunkeei]
MDKTNIGVEMTDVQSLISDNCYNVPSYQRHYSWDKESLNDFWDDLVDVMEGYQDSHFIGQVVTYVNDNVQEVIDGQQRLTTISILLAVVLDKINKIFDDVDGKPKNKLVTTRANIEELLRWDEKNPSLTLQEYKSGDNSIDDYFRGIFEGRTDLNSNNKNIDPVKNIRTAFMRFGALIDDYYREKKIKFATEKADVIENIFKSLKGKFILSKVSTRKKEEAYIIYQSLNSKGTPLKASELIKSHVMLQVSNGDDNEKEQVQKKWDYISTAFGNDSNKITTFIRVYWSAVKRVVTVNQLFRSITEEISDKNKTLSFLENLSEVVDYYVAMENALINKKDRELFSDDTIESMIFILKKLGVALHYPILFAMILRGTDKDSQRVVIYKILSVFIRHRTICGKGTNTLEKGYAKIAQNIWNQKISTGVEITRELDDELLKSDVEVKNSFQGLSKETKKTGEKRWTLVYLMYRLYKEYGDFEDIELNQVGLDKLSVIHINKDISSDYVDYIGNYALVENKLKDKYGENDIYRSLSESRYSVNNTISKQLENREWNIEDIIERQNDMSDKVIGIW